MVSCVLQVLTPYTTKYLIAFATEAYIARHKHAPGPHVRNGIGIAIGITVMQIVQSVTTSQFFFRGMMVGGQARAVLVSMIFSKATRLSGRARAGGKAISSGETRAKAAEQDTELRKARNTILTSIFNKKKHVGPTNAASGVMGDGTGWSNGRIVTLMSVDTDRIDKALGLFHLLWTSPIIIILALILLLVNIGYSALSGYALLVAGIPLLTHAIKLSLIHI